MIQEAPFSLHYLPKRKIKKKERTKQPQPEKALIEDLLKSQRFLHRPTHGVRRSLVPSRLHFLHTPPLPADLSRASKY